MLFETFFMLVFSGMKNLKKNIYPRRGNRLKINKNNVPFVKKNKKNRLYSPCYLYKYLYAGTRAVREEVLQRARFHVINLRAQQSSASCPLLFRQSTGASPP